MSAPEVAYQIPNNEWTDKPAASEPVQATFDIDNKDKSWSDSTDLTRGSVAYEQRAVRLAEEITERQVRQEIIARGDAIFTLRQAEIERLLAEPRSSFAKRVMSVLVSGQLDKRTSSDEARLRDEKLRLLANRESEIGASLLSKQPQVGRQVFFLSPHSTHANEWFYHAESIDQTQSRTIRYVVAEDGTFKSIDGSQYDVVVNDELSSFVQLTARYYKHVATRLYHVPPVPAVDNAFSVQKTDQSNYDLAA